MKPRLLFRCLPFFLAATVPAVQPPAPGGTPANAAAQPTITIRAAIDYEPPSVLTEAFEAGDASALEGLLRDGADVNAKLPDGDPPIVSAVRRNRPDLLQICLDYCANPSAGGKEGQGALTTAIFLNRLDLAETMLRNGVPADTPLNSPASADFRAAFSDEPFRGVLRFDVGVTPLMMTAATGNEDAARLLIRHQGNPDRRSRRYRTDAVSIACQAGQMRMAQILLGRDPEAANQKVVVNLRKQRAVVYRGDQVVLSSQCSTGRKGFSTPPGRYVVTSKHETWISTLYKVPMPWLMRLNGSEIGMHQGVVPGYPASHGCVRLPSGAAQRFFQSVKVGDLVFIE